MAILRGAQPLPKRRRHTIIHPTLIPRWGPPLADPTRSQKTRKPGSVIHGKQPLGHTTTKRNTPSWNQKIASIFGVVTVERKISARDNMDKKRHMGS